VYLIGYLSHRGSVFNWVPVVKRIVDLYVVSCLFVYLEFFALHRYLPILAGFVAVTLIVPPREATVRHSAAHTADGKNKSAGSRFSIYCILLFDIATPRAHHYTTCNIVSILSVH
jgi:hypothetical protein